MPLAPSSSLPSSPHPQTLKKSGRESDPASHTVTVPENRHAAREVGAGGGLSTRPNTTLPAPNWAQVGRDLRRQPETQQPPVPSEQTPVSRKNHGQKEREFPGKGREGEVKGQLGTQVKDASLSELCNPSLDRPAGKEQGSG